MPLSESELELIPKFEELSRSLNVSSSMPNPTFTARLSDDDKLTMNVIGQIVVNELDRVASKEKFRKNLEKSIANHMMRMAECRGKNIRMIRPPPNGLKIRANGEWVIPKKQILSTTTTQKRAKQLLSTVPMTIPKIGTSNGKVKTRTKKKRSRKKIKTRQGTKELVVPLENADKNKLNQYKAAMKQFVKARQQFIRSFENLKNELRGFRESSKEDTIKTTKRRHKSKRKKTGAFSKKHQPHREDKLSRPNKADDIRE